MHLLWFDSLVHQQLIVLSTFDDVPRCLNSIVQLMQREKAAHRSLVAAAGFFDADPLDSPVTNAPRRGQQHLSDSLCLLRQLGRRAEAEAHYNAAVQQGRIPWRNSLQRPGEMLEALFGVPYPTDPVAVGGGGAYIYILLNRFLDFNNTSISACMLHVCLCGGSTLYTSTCTTCHHAWLYCIRMYG